MSRTRGAKTAAALAMLAAAGCGGRDAQRSAGAAEAAPARDAAIDPCALLTRQEVERAGGFAVAAVEPGAVAGACSWRSADGSKTVGVLLSDRMSAMASSAEMATWRRDQAKAYGGVAFVIEPIEGLGAPAIRNEVEGSVAVEVAARGRLLGVTSPRLEVSTALAKTALGRLP